MSCYVRDSEVSFPDVDTLLNTECMYTAQN